MNDADANPTSPAVNTQLAGYMPAGGVEAATVPELCRTATTLFTTWDAIHDAADDLPAYSAMAQEEADTQGQPLIAASLGLVEAVSARRGITVEDSRAKADLALLWCRNRAGEDEGMDLLLSLARDVAEGRLVAPGIAKLPHGVPGEAFGAQFATASSLRAFAATQLGTLNGLPMSDPGFQPLEDAAEAVLDQADDAAARLALLPATTDQELRAKAALILQWATLGDDGRDALAASLARDVLGIAQH